ncbi:MAG: 5-formyltetrahydrofolate cyclo-ligase [Rhodospirillaceae bacterium]|jgi:5-formyltetrahydrofolate cyclo-ligase|nr:5-formyltetrahydrofolate cyclo-ligase [Rhodospirillaceae bacterium]MBT4220164.1 5-formyltetrahydrofolate cyclo-ligase [Rhodospirillaceae bacterium]MBT4463263.1 5-formyltetrahydrofolate cyclo-ligase [Rhodospirillaceae bacterium]MBT5307811.1 5-formyltetrahydrofolate cyclo-ligase [Rhodospirillaceae bacterium]MBT6407565.1 5-formyltetrahydrofolate cyclo-ligase [Rhodospirillaceae bacterium]
MSPDDDKARVRSEARAARRAAFKAIGAASASAIAEHAMQSLGSVNGLVVAGYRASNSEVDVGLLMTALADAGATLALPVVTGANQPLIFRTWCDGDELVEGAYGIDEPCVGSLEVRPDIVLVPLLAFDAGGHRLGQGGGFYDRTLDQLRTQGNVTAVGIGFASQELDAIPHADHDQCLDAVVTEDAMIRFESINGGKT